MVFSKPTKKTEEAPIEKAPVEKAKPPAKTDAHCVHEGCLEFRAPGQTYVCAKHMRSN